MSQQKSQVLVQRRILALDIIKRLSGHTERWVTVNEIAKDLNQQGYSAEIHSVRRDLKALLETHQQLECQTAWKNGQGIRENSVENCPP